MERKIICYILSTGKIKVFDSMEDLLRTYTSLTERRVENCIRTGQKWRGLAFDEVIE